MLIPHKLQSPVLKLLRSDNFEFIISFLYFIFRNTHNQNDTIKQGKLEKELENFIMLYNQKSTLTDKKEENAKFYIELWIKNQFLRRLESWDYESEYWIELSDNALQVLNFVDNLWIDEKYLHASVKSDFENAMSNLMFLAFSSTSLKEQNLKEIDKQIAELEKRKKLIATWNLQSFENEVYDKYIASKEILKKLPTSFRKVEQVFENIYNDINKKSNQTDINRGKILAFTLSEIEDKINRSPQWRSFEWFEEFYSRKPKELILALEEVFDKFDTIKNLEKEKKIRDLIDVDLLKAKKRAYNKKTFIVSKLKDIFNESNQTDKKLWIHLIKNIKKIYIDNIKNIHLKQDLCEVNDGVWIDLFFGKNFFEPKIQKPLLKYSVSEIQKQEIEVENIFRYSSISQDEILKRIQKFLENNDSGTLKDILKDYPIKYGIDEFLIYIKLANVENTKINKNTRQDFDIQGIHNMIYLKSENIQFIK